MSETASTPPANGYIVIDREWMSYASWNAGTGTFTVFDGCCHPGGRGGTRLGADGRHGAQPPQPGNRRAGYPGYPGFYYTVQFYPVNATGAEAHVIVTVGFGPQTRFRVQEFEGVYTPSQY